MVEKEEKVVEFCEKVGDFRSKVLHFLHLPPHVPPLGGNSAIGVEQGELIVRSFFNSPAHVDYNLRSLVFQSCAISSIGIQRKARKWRSGAKKGHYACVGAKKIGQSRVHVERNAYICTIIWPRFGIR